MDSTHNSFHFTDEIDGLPDHVFTSNGERAHEGTFRQSLKIANRNQGNDILGVVKKILPPGLRTPSPTPIKKNTLIYHYRRSDYRRYLYLTHYKKYCSEDHSDPSLAGKVPSWELLVLHRYAPLIIEEKMIELSEPLGDIGIAYEKIMEHICDLKAIWEASVYVVHKIGQKLIDELHEFKGKEIQPEREKLLAEVALAVATIDNPETLNIALSMNPNLCSHFTQMAAEANSQGTSPQSTPKEHSTKLIEEPSMTDSTNASSKIDSEQSMDEDSYLQAITDALEACKNDPLNTDLSHCLASLSQNFHQWLNDRPTIDFAEAFWAWVDATYPIGSSLHLDYFPSDDSEQEYRKVFAHAWFTYLKEESDYDDGLLLNTFENSWKNYQIWEDQTSKIVETITDIGVRIERVKADPARTPLEKRKQKEAIRRLQAEIDDAEINQDALSDDIAQALLPRTATLSIYNMEGDTEFDINDLGTLGLSAIEAFHHRDTNIVTTISQEQGDSEGETPEITHPMDDAESQDQHSDIPFSDEGAEPPPTSDDMLDSTSEPPAKEISNTEASPDEVSTQGDDTQPCEQEPAEASADETNNTPDEEAETLPESSPTQSPLAAVLEAEVLPFREKCYTDLDKGLSITGDEANRLLNQSLTSKGMNFASDLAYWLNQQSLSENFLPYELFKSAYYGSHTFSDRGSFSKAREELSKLEIGQCEQWATQQHSDAYPYLLFAASFQQALFGGYLSPGVQWLRHLGDRSEFDESLCEIMQETIGLADRKEQITLKYLKSGDASDEDAGFDLHGLNQWIQKINKGRRGYAPILKALKYSYDHGILGDVSQIIQQDRKDDYEKVSEFVANYDTLESSRALLQQTIVDMNQQYTQDINKMGITRFNHRVSELIEIARDWLSVRGGSQGDYSMNFARKFKTRLNKSLSHYQSLIDNEQNGKPQNIGPAIMVETLQRVLDALSEPERAWEYDRAKAWYYLPQMLSEIANVATDARSQVLQLIAELDSELDYVQLMNTAIAEQHTQLAEVCRLQLIDENWDGDLPNVLGQFHAIKVDLEKRCNLLDGKLENALLGGLIDAAKAEMYSGDIALTRDEIENLEPLKSLSHVQEAIEEFEQTLRDLTAKTRKDLANRFEKSLSEIRARVSEDAVPQAWVDTLSAAMKAENLPVANEMMEELETAVNNKSPIQMADSGEVKRIPVFPEFINAEQAIYDGVQSVNGHKAIWTLIGEGGGKFGLTFGKPGKPLNQVISALFEWSSSRPAKAMKKELYDRIIGLVSLLGIKPKDTQYKTNLNTRLDYKISQGFSSLKLAVDPSPSTRPFSLFGAGKSAMVFPIIIAHTNWTTQQLDDILLNHKIHNECLLISAKPLSPEQRAEFANYTKRKNKTVFHIDLVTLLFLMSRTETSGENTAIRNFLWLTAPFTYFNPFSDSLMPPSREMRFGREMQIESLLKMENGSAIVFGGRQLGKSTILKEVQARFHQPVESKQYAYSEMIDRNFDHKLQRKDNIKRARHLIWSNILKWMVEAGLANEPTYSLSDEKCDEIIKDVKQTMRRHKDIRFMAIFDEIDPILNVDSSSDFEIFRELRDFVGQSDVKGRFKIIIGGLQNVKRFENSPNYPLTQLGASLQISIMPAQEALHLVIEPLLAAGYRFEDAQVSNRVLAITNRHPGLLQLFCFELIKYLSVLPKSKTGERMIRNEDIDNVAEMEKVIDGIRNRFEMTLNLDHRYQIIIYSLIIEERGAQPFSPMESKAFAEGWAPEAFSRYSNKQFEAFLVELVGLGVLKQVSSGRYAIRNANVLKLLRGASDHTVAELLERAIDNDLEKDPLDRHSYNESIHVAPLPITSRDENAILGVYSDNDDDQPSYRQYQHSAYTVSIISGSQALGLDKLEATLPSLYADDNSIAHSANEKSRYTSNSVDTDNYGSTSDFARNLTGLISQSKKHPQMLFVHLGEKTTLAQTLAMLDEAHRHQSNAKELRHSVRIIFVMNPKAYWQWISAPKLTTGREDTQPFIRLFPWKNDAIRLLVDLLGMNDSDEENKEIQHRTEGWYSTLMDMVKARKAHKKWTHVHDFKSGLAPLTGIDTKSEALQFLKSTGLFDNEWAPALMMNICNSGDERIDLGHIEIFLNEIDESADYETLTPQLVRWLTSLNLLRAKNDKPMTLNNATPPPTYYEIPPSVRNALTIWSQND